MRPSRAPSDAAAPGPQHEVGPPLLRVLVAVLLVAVAVTGALVTDHRRTASSSSRARLAHAAPGAVPSRTPGGPGASAGTSNATSGGAPTGGPAGTAARGDGSASADSAGAGRSAGAEGSAAAPVRPDVGMSQRVRALNGLLAVRSRAMLRRDLAGWLSTIDGSATAFRARQAAVFANLRDVPIADWSYRYGGVAPALPAARLRQLGGSAWVARVLVGHRIRGFDTATSYSEQFLTVVRRGDRWALAADDDGDSAPQPWDLGRVHVQRGRHVLVLGTGSTGSLRAFAVDGDRAVERVNSVWGNRWPRRAVLVAPRTQAEFGRLLLRGRKGLDQVAAVTTGDLRGSTGDGSHGRSLARNDRVVVNPAAFDRLGATGRQVVMTHEVTHVAVRSTTSSAVPIWLSEGFADYVAYRGSGVSRQTSAADVLAMVRQGRGPTSLPTASDFDPTRAAIAPSYSSSLLACDLLADTYGERGLVRLYRAAALRTPDGAPDAQARLSSAFSRALGTSEQRFTADWRRYLARLAG